MEFLIPIIIILLYGIIAYIRNYSYTRKLRDLEELLDSKLRCTFFPPKVSIFGKYKNKKIEFTSHPHRIYRLNYFTLTTDMSLKQKKYMIRYPKVGQNVTLRNNKFIYILPDIFGNKISSLKKNGFAAILDEFLDVVEKVEHVEKISMEIPKHKLT